MQSSRRVITDASKIRYIYICFKIGTEQKTKKNIKIIQWQWITNFIKQNGIF